MEAAIRHSLPPEECPAVVPPREISLASPPEPVGVATLQGLVVDLDDPAGVLRRLPRASMAMETPNPASFGSWSRRESSTAFWM